jgi:hypothetical protein
VTEMLEGGFSPRDLQIMLCLCLCQRGENLQTRSSWYQEGVWRGMMEAVEWDKQGLIG